MNDQPETSDSLIPPRVQPETQTRKRIWPMMMGIIVLVIAGLASLSSIVGMVVTYSELEFTGGSAGLEAEQALYDNAPVIAWLGWINGGVCLLLVWTFGIGLIKRRRWGISHGRALSVFMLVQVVISIAGTYYRFPVMEQQFDDMPGGQSIKVIALVSMGFGFLINIVVSVAILSWLASARAKKEWETWA